jgi:prepilin-type N-terminal cleavage/methylation domain-containing protein
MRTLLVTIQKRLAAEDGFSLLELLTVAIILSILVAIAVPTYDQFQQNAHQKAAQSNVNTALPAAVQYFTENNDSYAGLTGSSLRTLSPGISGDVQAGSALGGSAFCVQATDGGITYAYPGGSSGSNVLANAICNSDYSVS